MGKYVRYLWYVIVHKYNVFIECWKAGMVIHGFTHDMSKFLPSEFVPYARWFYGPYGVKFKDRLTYCPPEDTQKHEKAKADFDAAWKLHYTRNKHHWNHWNPEREQMPLAYIRQMLCDWKAMSRKFGDTWQDFYTKNKDTMKLNIGTAAWLDAVAKEELND